MEKDRKIDVMAIVNLTGDSFYSASRCADTAAALGRIETAVSEGASIVDLGACSTRPGSRAVGAEEEWRRLGPVLECIRRDLPDLRVSIDTYWSDVVERAYDTIGHFIVNDISAGEDDPQMLPVAGRLGLEYVAMHKRGTPESMQSMADYGDVTEDVLDYFREFSVRAAGCGIRDWVLDPGFGFAKSIEQNYSLLRDLRRFKEVTTAEGYAPRILAGLSRKSMAYRLLDITPEESLPATQVLHLAALQNGADILRVHDVAEAVRTMTLYRHL